MPTINQTFQARVTGLWGHAVIRGADGKMHPLKLGDWVHRGDVILTSHDGIVQLSPPDERTAKPVDEQGIERIINALNSPDSQDATAAGVGFGDDGELAPMLRVARIAEYVTPASLERRVDDEARPAIHDETAVRPAPTPEPSIGASSTIIVATEGGTGVRLGLPPPVGVGSFATIVVNQVPMIGLIAKADGTVVNPGSMLTLPELAGLQYLPPADYNESDPIGKFAYTISDGGLSATGTVAVNLLLANDPPLAVADVASTNEDTPLAGNVLINDSDPNHDALTVTQFSVGGVSYAAGTAATISGVGTLVMQSDGAYTFTPTVNYHGPVPTVSYTIGDGDQSATSTLTIAVDSVNDVPKGQNDTASTPINTPLASINVLGNDSDVDGDTLSVTSAALANPALGSVSINPDGTLNFTPAPNVSGPVAIDYTISDGQGGTSPAVLTVNVGLNTPPAGADATFTIAEDTSRTFSAADFGFTDVDAGQTLANVRIDTLPAAGTLTFHGAPVVAGQVLAAGDLAQLLFTPAANANGSGYASFSFSVQDSAGAFDPAPNTITVDVTPVPDTATITGVGNGATIEDTTLVASGKLDVADPDAGQAAFQPQSNFAGAHGTFSIDGAGNWSYTLNNADPAVQALGNGQTLPSEVFTVRSLDGTTAQVTVSISGTDDLPVISSGTGAVTENTSPSASGSLTATDVDNPALAFVPATVAGNYGSLVLRSNGQWTYTLDARAEPLAQDQVVSEPFTVQLNDGSTTTVSITVTGTDDLPVISSGTGAVTENTSPSASGSLTATDVDNPTLAFVPATVSGSYGSLVLQSNGQWTYTLDARAEPLAQDQVVSEPFTVQLNDGSTTTVSITITGTNDLPVISSGTGAVTENTSPSVSGSLTATDVDNPALAFVPATVAGNYGSLVLQSNGQWTYTLDARAEPLAQNQVVSEPFTVQLNDGSTTTVSISITGTDDLPVISTGSGAVTENTAPSATGTLTATDIDNPTLAFVPATISGSYGSLVLQSNGQWTYTLDARAEPLAQNQVASEPFIVHLNDGSTTTVSISITGTDDLPMISTGSGAVTENTLPSATGTLTATDIDNPALAFVPATISGNYGSLVLQSNGQWTYTLDGRAEPLAQNQVVSEPFTVQLNDGSTTTVSISVTGVNDAAVITGTASGATIEDTTLVASGKLDVADPDAGEASFQPQTNFAGAHGTFSIDATGNWGYTLNNADPAVQALGTGQTLPSEAFTVRSVDGTTASVMVTITGTDDAPVISSGSGAVTENSAPSASGTLTATDVDDPTLAFVPATISGGYGSLTLLANGQWTYTLDARAEPLAQNQVVSEPITVQLTDGSTTTVTISVTGTNDAAVITGTAGGTVTEDATLVASGSLAAADIDSPATFTPQSASLTYGDVSINAAGQWIYTLRNGDANVQALTSSQHPVETVLVATADGTTQQITITVNGANEAPSAIATPASGAEDAAGIPIVLAGSDVDGSLASFTLTTLPLNGTLFYAGNPVTAGMVIPANANSASLSFVPNANWNGSTGLTFSTTDNEGASSAPATQSITVAAVNDAPVASNDTFSTSEDTPITFGVLGNDSDVDGDALTITQIDGTAIAVGASVNVAGGSVTLNANGTLTFTPTLNYNGSPSFTYTVLDGHGGTANGTVNGTVTPINDAPLAVNDSATTPINTALANIVVLANDADADGDALSVTGATLANPALGSVSVNPDGTLNFAPAPNVSGPVAINYTITDGQGGTSSAVLTVNVGANTPPSGANETVTIAEDTSKTFGAADFGFSDPDAGQALAGVRIDSLPGAGSLTLNGAAVAAGQLIAVADLGTLVFTPAANGNGNGYASFTFSVQDSAGSFDPVPNTITIDVTAVNDAPTQVVPGAQSTAEDTAHGIDGVTVADVDGGALTTTLTVTHGTLSVAASGAAVITSPGSIVLTGTAAQINTALAGLSHTPAPDYNGADTLTVSTSDGIVPPVNSSVAITVTPVADIVADSVSTPEDTAIVFNPITGSNGASADNFEGSPVLSAVGAPSHGSTSFNAATGQITYTPAANYNGPDFFTYTVSSGGVTETATINVNVTAVNDPPTITGALTGTVKEDTTLVASQTLTVSDPDGPAESAFIAQSGVAGTYGTFGITSAGTWTYTLNNGSATVQQLGATASLTENFTIATVDGTQRTVTVTVNGTNDTPTAVNDSATVAENATLNIAAAGGVLSNDSDIDLGDTKSVSGVAFGATTGTIGSALAGTYGTLTLNADGSYSYAASQPAVEALAQGNSVTESFTYTMRDASGATSNATLTLTINGANDAPVANADSGVTTEDTTLTRTAANGVLANDTDADAGTTLSVTQFTIAGSATVYTAGSTASIAGVGTLTLNADGGYTFAPAANYNGAVPLVTYTVSDGIASTSSTLNLSITPVNDAPVNTIAALSTNEDTALKLSGLSIADVDAASGTMTVTLAVTSGTISAASSGGVTIAGSGGSSITLTGTLANINGYLASAASQPTFNPVADFNGSVSLTMTTNDNGNTGGAALSDVDTVLTTINPVNDAPTQAVPAAQSTAEDAAGHLVFSSANGNAITVADIDSASLTTTLSAAHGTLTLASTAGLTVSNNGSGSVTLSGSAAAINTALNGLVYANTPDYNGADTLTVSTSDGIAPPVNSSVAITVTPVADIVADSVSTPEDTAIVFNPITGSNGASADNFEGSPVLSAVGAPSHGSTSFNAATGQITYTPATNYNGPDSFTYTVTSGGVTETATVNVSVTAVNDPPVNTVPGPQSTAEDTVRVFNSGNGNLITVGDVDTASVSTTVSVLHGLLTATTGGGASITANGSASVTIAGTVAQVNAALAGLQYAPVADYNGSDTLTVQTNDGSATSSNTVAITVTPVADIVGDSLTTAEDTAITANVITGSNGASADNFENPGAQLTAVTQGANGSVTFTSSGQVTYTPNANYNGSDSFTYTVTSGGVSETATVNVTVTAVNDAPVLSLDADHSHNTVAVQSISGLFNTGQSNTGGTVNNFTQDLHYTLISQPAGATTSAVVNSSPVWLANDADSKWIGAGGSNQPTGRYSFQTSFTLQAGADPRSTHISFDVADDNTLVDILVNGVSANVSSQLGFGSFTHVELDGGAAFTSGTNTITFVVENNNYDGDSKAGPIGLRVDNMTGTVAVIAGSGTVHLGDYATDYIEGTPVSIADSDVLIQDVDSATMQSATITLTNAQTGDVLTVGALPAGVTASVNAAGTQVTLSGAASLASYQAAIKAIQFNNTTETPPTAVDRLVTVVVNDGQADSNTATTTIHVVSINDGPQAQADTAVAVEAGGVNNGTAGINPSGNVFTNDSDRDGSALTVTWVGAGPFGAGIIGASTNGTYGTLVLNSDGNYQYTLNNNLAAVQALRPGDTLTDTFTYHVSDPQGATSVSTLTITAQGANDAPVNTVPGAQSTAEDTVRVFSSANGNQITVGDVDSASVTTTVSVLHGALTATTGGGATITANGSASVTMAGTVAQVNAALAGLQYGPVADYNGADSLSISTSDGVAAPVTSSVAITVSAVADITADAAVTNEDTAVTINVLANDTFENPGHTITQVNGAAIIAGGAAVAVTNGSVGLDASGQLVFMPAADYSGAASFNYTVTSGGVTETAGVNVTVNPVNDAPVINASTASVSEEGLTRGLVDSTGSTDTTNARIVSGSMAVSDVDGTPTVTFAAPAPGLLTSGGQTVTWSGAGTNLLVGSTAVGEVLRIAISNTGAYTVTLSRPVDHAIAGGEDLRSLSFGVNASDGIATASSTLTVNIEDDSPVAAPINQTLPMTPEPPDVNLMIILDKSSSMSYTYSGSQTRMDYAHTAINALLDNYANYGGTVRVKIVSFGDVATEEGGDGSMWVDIATAKTLVSGVQPVAPNNGTTWYDIGLAKAQTAYQSPGKLADAASVSYFISDGDPTSGHAINASEEAGWRTFLESNGIKSLAFGVIESTEGTDLETTSEVAAALDPVAYDGETRTDLNATAITSFADMGNQLVPAPFGTAHGSLVAVPGTTVQGFGADGGYVLSLTVEGTTYTYNPASGGSISVTGINHSSFNASTDVLTITIANGTNAGDKLMMNMDTGFYEYHIHAATSAPVTQGFSYTLTDLDGDISSSSASITLSPFIAVNDDATTPVNGNVLSTTVDQQGDVLSVTGVVMNGTTFATGTNVAGVYGTLVVNTDGTYSYTADSAQASTNGLFSGQRGTDVFTINVSDGQGHTTTSDLVVQVTGSAQEISTTFIGNTSGNTLNGTAGTDLLDGLAGNDTLIGNAGTDLLIGGKGNDTLTGGAGADTFLWRLADNGTTSSPAADTITDFNTASRASGGDVLDLRDLLIGEYHVGTDAGNLSNYLHFEHSGKNDVNTLIYVSTTGAFSGGFNANSDNQNITLQNVNLIGTFTSDQQIIENLLKQGKLVVDAG